ncbi:aminotransferase class I/II-fold pyridoxal phosphate-dependent enzyme [Flavobacterium rakeshii]|uniref:Aminotransferase class I/II-fold pyridoxal phosphate-dependent enzyme n=1 Tax=Flavobacterium rakeshii TaxID=1038845 RepID=A0A6N8HF85_9FLAO|nr:PLP-dependent aminotransferase family protein [Flavobacterium rakeshii]MUV04377.1 aminotransferase class I/II-fold pyridoxal phosphate-dependent enzyme [Flavobacterium rakeshii]
MKSYKFEKFTSVIEKNIREGIYKPGHKLPSVRELKQQYQTSITTIQNGYEHLMIMGLVESIPKSGYYVTNRQEYTKTPEKKPYKPVVRDAVFKQNLNLITSHRDKKGLSEFNVAKPGDLLTPQKLILRTMQQAIREQSTALLRYYPSNGDHDLKINIAKRAAAHRSIINAEELIITDGALQALYISLAAVCSPDDVVAIESPCIFSVLEVIRILKLKIIEIPTGVTDGFDISFLKRACKKTNIKAIVVTPNYHNPTGNIMTNEQKKTLLSVAQQHNIAIIENDIYGDLNFSGMRPSNIKGFDDSGLVLTYSSYAKTLAPGIRLGWLSCGKFLPRAEQIKFALGSTVSPIFQETINRLLSGSSYDRHLRAFRLQLAKNAHFTTNLILNSFPEETMVTTPKGGYNIWVKMPDYVNMDSFYSECEKIGVRFTPGLTFSFSNIFEKNFRIVFADKFSEKRIQAIKLAGQYCKNSNKK